MQPVDVDVEPLAVPVHPRDEQTLQRGRRRVVGLEDVDRADLDLRHDASCHALAQEGGERFDLGELRHAASLVHPVQANQLFGPPNASPGAVAAHPPCAGMARGPPTRPRPVPVVKEPHHRGPRRPRRQLPADPAAGTARQDVRRDARPGHPLQAAHGLGGGRAGVRRAVPHRRRRRAAAGPAARASRRRRGRRPLRRGCGDAVPGRGEGEAGRAGGPERVRGQGRGRPVGVARGPHVLRRDLPRRVGRPVAALHGGPGRALRRPGLGLRRVVGRVARGGRPGGGAREHHRAPAERGDREPDRRRRVRRPGRRDRARGGRGPPPV